MWSSVSIDKSIKQQLHLQLIKHCGRGGRKIISSGDQGVCYETVYPSNNRGHTHKISLTQWSNLKMSKDNNNNKIYAEVQGRKTTSPQLYIKNYILFPTFSSVKFTISDFILRHLIHLDLNFVQGESIFTALPTDIQLDWHCLLNVFSFLLCVVLASLLRN